MSILRDGTFDGAQVAISRPETLTGLRSQARAGRYQLVRARGLPDLGAKAPIHGIALVDDVVEFRAEVRRVNAWRWDVSGIELLRMVDQRRDHRAPLDTLVRWRPASRSEDLIGRADDISISGLALRSARPAPDEPVAVAFSIGAHEIRAVGQVRRSHRGGFAVEFTRLGAKDRAVVAEYVSAWRCGELDAFVRTSLGRRRAGGRR